MGNRQGGKLGSRPELPYQQKTKKQTPRTPDGSNVDTPSSHLHPAVFHPITVHTPGSRGASQSAALHSPVADGSAVDDDGNVNFVSRIVQEERHATCLPEDSSSADTRSCLVVDGGDSSASDCSHTPSLSPIACRRQVLQPSNGHNLQHTVKKQFTTAHIFTDVSSVGLLRKPCCLATDSVTSGGVISPSAVSCADCTAAHCMDTLENLKKNIEHSHTENFPHFNNTGFAQLQSGTDFDDYDNAAGSKEPETSTHRRSKSMSPQTAVSVGSPKRELRKETKVVRKLSEPSKFVYRTDSVSSKTVIPGAWSKSAENSPIIVRKALPKPGSPVIVQRTPSQSPSVQRRFPANAPPGAILSEYCAESLDSLKSRPLVYQKVVSTNQDCLEAKEASHSIRQKVAGEISIPRVSNAPISVRKPPESPLVFSSPLHIQEEVKDREKPSNRTTGDHGLPAFIPLETSKLYHMRVLTSSSCSSSPSESLHGKLPLQEDSVPLFIPSCTSSTSACTAALGTSSPTPIQFCPQPKGTPVRTCTMTSQPSTAVVLHCRESQENLVPVDTGLQSAQDTGVGKTTGVQMTDCRTTSGNTAPAENQPSGSAVTEDTIKQNSQSAVFGSVSPKLLRHRRLVKENCNPTHDQHTFPKQSHPVHITAAKTYPRNGESAVIGTSDSVSSDAFRHMHMNCDDGHLSHSAPSSFSLHGTNDSGARAGNKTLGQRIREVINETAVERKSDKETSLFRKHEKVFSKDDIFASISSHEKSAVYSFSSHSRNENESFVCEKSLPVQKVSKEGMDEDRPGVRAGDLRMKPPLFPAGAKDTVRDTRLPKSTGYSYYLSSSRDSCSSCISDSSQLDSYDTTSVAREGMCLHTDVLPDGGHCRQGGPLVRHLGVPGQRLVTSDTSDTLSTDRDTSSSSKRESSTSTATDDTLTSFKTRSTTGSAEFEDGFVLPESLVFIRSADKDAQHDLCAFESEQTTIKRKLVQGHLPESRAEHEPVSHKTRKKRRKQQPIQSQTITARCERAGSTLTRSRAAHDIYSDDVSDDSDLYGSKDDISDFPSSRGDISDLPSSRDDISDIHSSRDDISDIHSSRGTISDIHSSRGTISDIHSSRDTISDIHSSRDDIPEVSDRKPTAQSRSDRPHNITDDGAITRRIFHRSDLQSSRTSPHGSGYDSRDEAGELAGGCQPLTARSDSKVTLTFTRGRSYGQVTSPDVCEMTSVAEGAGAVPPQPLAPNLAPGKPSGATRPNVLLPAGSPFIRPRKRLTGTSVAWCKQTGGGRGRERAEHLKDTNRPPVYTHHDEGKELLLRRPDSPENEDTVVLPCTIYNSAMAER